jgi:hypothetical protein
VEFETLLKHNKKLLVIVGVCIIALFTVTQLQPMEIGYLSGTQGLEPQFNSVKWHNSWWSATEKGSGCYLSRTTLKPVEPSSRSFGFTMQFDPDDTQGGMPDLCASTQTLTQESDAPVVYSWSVPAGSKTLSNGTIVQVTKQFDLYKYRMDWAMNLWLSGSEDESEGKYYNNPNPLMADSYVDGGSYSSAELWIKLVPKAFCYFTENPDAVYFAPAYIALKEPVSWIGVTPDGTKTLNDHEIEAIEDIIPEATGESLGVYYQRGGADVLTDSKLLSYNGLTLDPSIFRNEYWTRINLVDFKAKSWFSWGITHGWKYPSAYLHFMVDLFVVGQWTVYYQTGDVPKLEPHLPVVNYDILTLFGAWLSSPATQIYLIFILAVIVLIIIAWRMPWLFKLTRRNNK